MRETKNLKTQLFASSFTLQCVAGPLKRTCVIQLNTRRVERRSPLPAPRSPRSMNLLFSYIPLLRARFFVRSFFTRRQKLFSPFAAWPVTGRTNYLGQNYRIRSQVKRENLPSSALHDGWGFRIAIKSSILMLSINICLVNFDKKIFASK